MGERELDSCLGVNRRSLCVLPTEICDQLSVSVSQEGIVETLWVGVSRGCIRGSYGKERERGGGGQWLGSGALHAFVLALVLVFGLRHNRKYTAHLLVLQVAHDQKNIPQSRKRGCKTANTCIQTWAR